MQDQFKSLGDEFEEINQTEDNLSIDEQMAIIDAIADADFAKEYGITVDEIPDFLISRFQEI